LRGFGERSDWMPPDKYHCDWDLVCATMAGIVPLERNLWDLQRALDVLAAQPLVDATRIAAAGLSYGGTCALFLAAIDQRVRAAVVSGYLSSWSAAHTVPWNMCGSQVMPGQLGALEHLDVAALIAPRPLLVESGTEDVIFPVAAARETVAALRRVYASTGAPGDAVVHDVFAGDHQWHGVEVPAFLERVL
jgi:dienelactone hydrolase